ncbi:MAG TPA: hypothetical protein QF753_17835 [Victivallales bacterium]|nr:hypothetical protein [Victivallales bacterium]
MEESYNSYKIVKINKTVDILLTGRKTPQKYIIYLSLSSKYSKNHETINEYINSEKPFLPTSQIISKDKIEFAAINLNEIFYVKDGLKVSNPVFYRQAIITLTNGIKLKTGVVKTYSKGYERVIDYLNVKDQFIEFVHENQYIHVNKNKILKVLEIQSE